METFLKIEFKTAEKNIWWKTSWNGLKKMAHNNWLLEKLRKRGGKNWAEDWENELVIVIFNLPERRMKNSACGVQFQQMST